MPHCRANATGRKRPSQATHSHILGAEKVRVSGGKADMPFCAAYVGL